MEAFRRQLTGLRTALPDCKAIEDGFHVEAFVRRLDPTENAIANDDLRMLDRLCKKIEVPRRLCSIYTLNLDKAVERTPVRNDFLRYLCGVYLWVARETGDLKFLNTGMKLLDGVLRQPELDFPDTYREFANLAMAEILRPGPREKPSPRNPAPPAEHVVEPRVIDLAILGEEDAASTRAYLAYLSRAGYRPRKLIFLEYYGGFRKLRNLHKIIGHRAAGRVVTQIKNTLAARRVDPQNRHYSQQIQANLPLQIDYFGRFEFQHHAESIERITIRDLADPRLVEHLAKDSCRAFLYACSGLVPAPLLQHQDIRIIHTHPGIVPDVKGADGLLWSLAVRGAPGASCFYMSPGIDTGEIIATREFPSPLFKLPSSLKNSPTLYKLLLPAFDRYMRADLFVDVVRHAVESDEHLANLSSEPQDPMQGRTYFFMHEALRNRILDSMVHWVNA